jgi:hypothetical protein
VRYAFVLNSWTLKYSRLLLAVKYLTFVHQPNIQVPHCDNTIPNDSVIITYSLHLHEVLRVFQARHKLAIRWLCCIFSELTQSRCQIQTNRQMYCCVIWQAQRRSEQLTRSVTFSIYCFVVNIEVLALTLPLTAVWFCPQHCVIELYDSVTNITLNSGMILSTTWLYRAVWFCYQHYLKQRYDSVHYVTV